MFSKSLKRKKMEPSRKSKQDANKMHTHKKYKHEKYNRLNNIKLKN